MARILLIDDDRLIRRQYSDGLRSEQFEVVEVGSAEDGLDILLRGEKFDLIITDIMLAKMGGWELLDTIRGELGLNELILPVIVISAFDCAEIEVKALHRGANGYLIKPIIPLSKLTNMAKIHTGLVKGKYLDT